MWLGEGCLSVALVVVFMLYGIFVCGIFFFIVEGKVKGARRRKGGGFVGGGEGKVTGHHGQGYC